MPAPHTTEAQATAFLVERYVPRSATVGLADSVARVALLCIDAAAIERGMRYLQSAYLPSEDTCFCLFLAPSSDAVRQINDDGEFPLDRITPAVLLHREPTPHR